MKAKSLLQEEFGVWRVTRQTAINYRRSDKDDAETTFDKSTQPNSDSFPLTPNAD
jgi:hypothetical protein